MGYYEDADFKQRTATIEGETCRYAQGFNLWVSSKSRYFHGKELDHNASIKKVSKRYHSITFKHGNKTLCQYFHVICWITFNNQVLKTEEEIDHLKRGSNDLINLHCVASHSENIANHYKIGDGQKFCMQTMVRKFEEDN